MAIPTPQMMDALIYGTGISWGKEFYHIPLFNFFFLPEPGERSPWGRDKIYLRSEPYDDGGGPALAFYQFGQCPFITPKEGS